MARTLMHVDLLDPKLLVHLEKKKKELGMSDLSAYVRKALIEHSEYKPKKA